MELSDETLLWMPLFWQRGKNRATPAQELARIAEWARRLFEGDACEEALDDAIPAVLAGHFDIAKAVRADELPLSALEVFVGITALAAPRADETIEYAGSAVWSLAEPTVQPTSVVSALVRSPHATYPPLTDPWGKFLFRPTDTESGREPSTPERTAFVDRAAPLAIGGLTFESLDRQRPVAWHNRHVSVVWEALCAAFDVFAGSQLATDQLVALAERAPEAPGVLWLAEAGLRLVREPARAARVAERLDALLASGRYGKNAVALTGLEDRRAQLAEDADGVGDALLRVGAIARKGRPRSKDLVGETSAEETRLLEEAADEGDDLAKALVTIGRFIEEEAVEVDWERDAEGPFHGLFVPEDLQKRLDPAVEEVMLGFRCVYGLERLGVAIPALQAWRVQMAS